MSYVRPLLKHYICHMITDGCGKSYDRCIVGMYIEVL